MKRTKKAYFLGFVFALLGLGFLFLSIFTIYKDARFVQSSATTSGTVISIEHQRASSGLVGGGQGRNNGGPVDVLTISFNTLDGKSFTFVNDFGISAGIYKVGDIVSVVYDKNNPNSAHLSQPGNVTLWAFDVFYLLISIFLLFCCWVCVRPSKIQSMA